jgi:hypothetical protein
MSFEKGDLVDILSHEYKGVGIFLEFDKLPTSLLMIEPFVKIFILDDQPIGFKQTLWFHPTEIRKHKNKGRVNE